MRVDPIPEHYAPARPGPAGMTAIGAGHYISGLFIGAMKSGKTTALLNLLRGYERAGAFDVIWYISRTSDRDPKVKSVLAGMKKADVRVFDDAFTVQQAMDAISRMNDEYELLKDYLPVWKRYVQAERRDTVHKLSKEDISALEAHGYMDPSDVYPDVSGLKQEPVHCLVLDDMLGSDELSTRNNSALNRLLSIHRHLRVNVFVSLQAFSQSLSPALRASMNLFCLWRCKSHKIQKSMAESLAGHVTETEFIRLWDRATSESRHDFLCVDLSTDQVFHKGFRGKIPGARQDDEPGGPPED